MSKLLKLKDWLTLEDAAKHLSIMFGEEVAKADILRLALDGRLTLSINLVNGAKARCGPIVARDKVKYTEFPSDLKAAMNAKSPERYQGSYVKVPMGVSLKNGDVIELADDIVSLRGIYDLPMIGSERLDVENEYQSLTNGPPVTLIGLNGAFVIAGRGTYCQLQERLNDEEWQADRAPMENYFPAGLPKDSVLVVRSAALFELHAAASAPEASDRRTTELGTRERETLLKLVIGMAIEGYRYSPDAPRSDAPAEIVGDLAKHGISVTDDTVRKWLREAANTVLPKEPRKT